MLTAIMYLTLAWIFGIAHAAAPVTCKVGYVGQAIHTDYQCTDTDGAVYEAHRPCRISGLSGEIDCPSPLDLEGYVRVGFAVPTPPPAPTPVRTVVPDPLQPCRDKLPGWHWSSPACPNIGPCSCLPGAAPTATPRPSPTPTVRPTGTPGPAVRTPTPTPRPLGTVLPRPTVVRAFVPARVRAAWFPWSANSYTPDRPAYATTMSGTGESLMRYGQTIGSMDYLGVGFLWDSTPETIANQLSQVDKVLNLARDRGIDPTKRVGVFLMESSPFAWAQWQRDYGLTFMKQDPVTKQYVPKTGKELQAPIADSVVRGFMDPMRQRGIRMVVAPYVFSWSKDGPRWPNGRIIPEEPTSQVFGKNIVDFAFWLDAMKAYHPDVEVVPQISNCCQRWGTSINSLTSLLAAVMKAKGYPLRAQIERCVARLDVEPERQPLEADCQTLKAMEAAGFEVSIWDNGSWIDSVGKELEGCPR